MPFNINRSPDYSDLDLDFTAHPATGDVARKTGVEAIKRSVRNLVLTNFYERPFQPHIGSNALALLFENATPLTAVNLQNAIKEVIENFEPRVELLGIEVKLDADRNGYSVKLGFRVNNRLEPVVTSLFLKRLR